MLTHMFMATVLLIGFFDTYLVKYVQIKVVTFDIGQSGSIDFAKRQKYHETVKQEARQSQIIMMVLSVLAAWSYVMTTMTNPGYIDPEIRMNYTKEDLNKKLVLMFKNNKS